MIAFRAISCRRQAMRTAAEQADQDVYLAVYDARLDGLDEPRATDFSRADFVGSGRILAQSYRVPDRWRVVWAREYARVSAACAARFARGAE